MSYYIYLLTLWRLARWRAENTLPRCWTRERYDQISFWEQWEKYIDPERDLSKEVRVANCILQRWMQQYLPTQSFSMTVPLPHQEVKCTPPSLETGWVLVTILDQLEVSGNVTLWLLRIAYKNVTHFLHGALALGIQTSWCEEVQETHGEAPTRRETEGCGPQCWRSSSQETAPTC